MITRRRGLRAVVGLAALTLVWPAGFAPAQAPPRPPDPAVRVYIVPLGAVPPAFVNELVAHFKAKLGLTITPLPPFAVEPAAMDHDRVQLVAQELVASLRRRLPQHAGNVVIGLTTYDMYIRSVSWEWAFAYLEGNRVAVVSTARMDPTNWGEAEDPERLRVRLRKMVAKNLGLMYYGLGQSSDRRSVLFGPILGLGDLDAVGEDF